MDLSPLAGETVVLEIVSLSPGTGEPDLVRSVLEQSFRSAGAKVVDDPALAEWELTVRIWTAGIERREDTLGLPSISLTVVPVPIPSFSLLRVVDTRSLVRLEIWGHRRRGEEGEIAFRPSEGRSYLSLVSVLGLRFTSDDVYEADAASTPRDDSDGTPAKEDRSAGGAPSDG